MVLPLLSMHVSTLKSIYISSRAIFLPENHWAKTQPLLRLSLASRCHALFLLLVLSQLVHFSYYFWAAPCMIKGDTIWYRALQPACHCTLVLIHSLSTKLKHTQLIFQPNSSFVRILNLSQPTLHGVLELYKTSVMGLAFAGWCASLLWHSESFITRWVLVKFVKVSTVLD